jgi:hypothetical protein
MVTNNMNCRGLLEKLYPLLSRLQDRENMNRWRRRSFALLYDYGKVLFYNVKAESRSEILHYLIGCYIAVHLGYIIKIVAYLSLLSSRTHLVWTNF